MAVNIEGRLLKPVGNDGSISHGPLISQLSSYYPKDSLVYLGEYGPYSEFYLIETNELRLKNNYTKEEFNVVPRKLTKIGNNKYEVSPIDKLDVFNVSNIYTLISDSDPHNAKHLYISYADRTANIAEFNGTIDYKTVFKYAGYILDEDGEEK